MNPILKGQPFNLTIPVRDGQVAHAIPLTDTVTVTLTAASGGAALIGPVTAVATATGADWPNGLVVVPLTATQTGALPLGDAVIQVHLASSGGTYTYGIAVQAPAVQSLLFNKADIVPQVRQDMLFNAAAMFMNGNTPSDDYIWRMVCAAEKWVGHQLKVDLVPTQYFAAPPNDARIAALAGMPWKLDEGYDYNPDFFQDEKWGFVQLRHTPLVTVQSIQFVYPDPTSVFFTVPPEWFRLDRQYGILRLVPGTSIIMAPLNVFALQALGGGRTVPQMLMIDYQAGLQDALNEYPDLVNAILQQAVLNIIANGFPPQSGSISADGLSQSLSVDISKYRDDVREILFGPKGMNGGLWSQIHGIGGMIMS